MNKFTQQDNNHRWSSVRPVTVRQVLCAERTHSEAGYMLDGQPLQIAYCVACIVRIEDENKDRFYVLEVEDGSRGRLRVFLWKREGREESVELVENETIRPCTYVRIHGYLIAGKMQFKNALNAMKVEPIGSDPIEIFHHLFNCMVVTKEFEKLQMKKENPAEKGVDPSISVSIPEEQAPPTSPTGAPKEKLPPASPTPSPPDDIPSREAGNDVDVVGDNERKDADADADVDADDDNTSDHADADVDAGVDASVDDNASVDANGYEGEAEGIHEDEDEKEDNEGEDEDESKALERGSCEYFDAYELSRLSRRVRKLTLDSEPSDDDSVHSLNRVNGVIQYRPGAPRISGLSSADRSNNNKQDARPAGDPLSKLTVIERDVVLHILSRCSRDAQDHKGSWEGVNVADIARSLQMRYKGITAIELSDALDSLTDEGYIATTIDESHYEVCNGFSG